MMRGGTIIRLIDVVLILLLGFLGITDFEIKSQVKLPSSSASKNKENKQQIVFLNIIENDSFEIVEGQRTVPNINGIQALETFLYKLNNYYLNNNNKMIVIIEPELETIIQTTIAVMDICEKYRIPKNLSYSKFELN